MYGIQVVGIVCGVTHQDVVKFNVIVNIATLMDYLQLVQELYGNLKNCFLCKCLTSLEQIVLESISEPILHDVRPYLPFERLKAFVKILIRKTGQEVLVVAKPV